MNLNNSNFKENKEEILRSLQYGIDNLDMEYLSKIRENKTGL